MKPILTAFVDQEGKASLNDQIDKAIKMELDHLCLRAWNGQPLIELSEGELKKILLDTKGSRVKIAFIDANINPYDPYDDRKHAKALDEYKYMLKVADRLKATYVLMRLPIINNVIEEFDTLEKRIGDFVDAAMRAGQKFVIMPDQGIKSNTYAYLFKKMKSKHMAIAFDPVMVMMANESTTTAYRLLRNYIVVFFSHDANHQGQPELIGYGKSETLKLLKKLQRDRYDGFIVMDQHFHQTVFKQEDVKKGFFKKLFSNDQKKKENELRILSRLIFPDEETKNVTEDDILRHQIQLVRTLFKE